MESRVFEKMEQWFQKLDGKIETVKDSMATKQQLENRFQMLFTSMKNLHERVETYKGQQEDEIHLIKRAIHDLEREVKALHS